MTLNWWDAQSALAPAETSAENWGDPRLAGRPANVRLGMGAAHLYDFLILEISLINQTGNGMEGSHPQNTSHLLYIAFGDEQCVHSSLVALNAHPAGARHASPNENQCNCPLREETVTY